jgi:hypothetical protein
VVSESNLALAGAAVRLRIAGPVLAAHVEGPFAPRRVAFADTPPALAVDLWDAQQSGVAGDALHAGGRAWDLGEDASFAASPGARFISYAARGGITWFDREANHIVGFHADGESLSLQQRLRPLQMLLGLWANDRGLQPVHAALVARDGRGVLLAGRSGSGKSTAALACLDAGYTYLGDDWIALELRHGAAIGHGFYASAALEPEHARRFPFLQPYLVRPGRAEPKAYAVLSHGFPERLAGEARIVAVVLPRVVEALASAAHAASARDVLLGLVPSSIFTMEPRGSRDGVARFATLARQVPAWSLDVGRRLDDIPRCLDAILAASPLCGAAPRPLASGRRYDI